MLKSAEVNQESLSFSFIYCCYTGVVSISCSYNEEKKNTTSLVMAGGMVCVF